MTIRNLSIAGVASAALLLTSTADARIVEADGECAISSAAEVATLGTDASGNNIANSGAESLKDLDGNHVQTGFDEQPDDGFIELMSDVVLTHGTATTADDTTISAGRLVSSAMIYLNRTPGGPDVRPVTECTWTFDREVVGIASSIHGQDQTATNALFGHPDLEYDLDFNNAGAEPGDADSFTPTTVTIDSTVTEPGDWFRIFTLHATDAVELVELKAERVDAGVKLSWDTASEVDCGQFQIERCAGDACRGGHYEPISGESTVACQDSLGGASYTITDFDVPADMDVRYILREFETSGTSSMYGPVRLAADQDDAVWIPTKVDGDSGLDAPVERGVGCDASGADAGSAVPFALLGGLLLALRRRR